MEATLKKTGIDCWHRTFFQTIRKEETQDAVVPDTCPDIDCILDTTGCVLLRSKDVSAGKMKVEANIPARVAFLPEGEKGVYCLEVNVPLYVSGESELITDDSLCRADLTLLSLDTRVLNPRKVLVRAEVSVTLTCYDRTELSFSCGTEEAGQGINTLIRPVELTPEVCVTEKTFVLTDEYAVPAAKPPASRILSQRTELVTDDVKPIGSKLMLKGSVKSRLLCAAEEGGVSALDFTTSYSQIIEAGESDGELLTDVGVMLTGAYYDIVPDSLGRKLGMELHLVAQAVVREKRRVEVLTDAYCNSRELEMEHQERTEECVSRELLLRDTLRETMETPPGAVELCDSYAVCGAPSPEGGSVSVPVTVCVLYRTAEGRLGSVRRKYEARLAAELEPGERCGSMSIGAPDLYAVAAGGEIELRIPVELRLQAVKDTQVRDISAIHIPEESLDLSGKPSLVLLRASSADDLWSLARENCSTVEAICQANGLEEGTAWEKTIIIPKIV